MITKEDVLRLAALARLDIPDEQLEKTRADIDAILAYVGSINEASAKLDATAGASEGVVDSHIVKNALRADEDAHESGRYTDALLAAAPASEKGYVKVKKIL